jgi:hypothetical protein
MLRCLATFLIVCVICGNGLVVIAQDQLDLSEDFPAALPFTAAKQGSLEVHTKLSDSGEIVVVVSLKNIATKASRHSGLPNKEYVGEWSVRFTVVPMLSDREVREIRELVEQIPHDKSHVSKRESLMKCIPDLATSTRAYRIGTCPVIPVEHSDREIVESFIRKLSKELRNIDGSDSEKRLKDLLLQ